MKYDITIIRVGFDGTMALKVLDIYGQPGYDVKIWGYTGMKEGEEDVN